MIVLAIDTSHELGSLALANQAETLEEVVIHEPGGFSGILFDQIGTLLARHQLLAGQVGLYAAAAGPGSFTGVRIGLTAAKALAEAGAKPCFGISNLEAMARSGYARTRAVFLDARRGEVYGAAFGAFFSDEVVAAFPDWLASLPSGIDELLTFDFKPYEAVISQSRFAEVPRTRVPRALAASVAALARERYAAGYPGDVASLDANYVRRSDAELLWKDRL